MKAYRAWDENCYENYSTVVFAENAAKAKAIALTSDACEDARFTDIRVKRLPEMDKHYRGLPEVDWYNDEDRKALVALGWHCYEAESWECAGCVAKEICEEYKEGDQINE